MQFTLKFTFLLTLFFGSICFAEPTLGRLPDGRAYRIGSDGTQLVDYIAELEMQVEAQNRRIQGLEFEIEQKQALLQRAPQRQVSEIEEKTLLDTRANPQAENELSNCILERTNLNSRFEQLRVQFDQNQRDSSARIQSLEGQVSELRTLIGVKEKQVGEQHAAHSELRKKLETLSAQTQEPAPEARVAEIETSDVKAAYSPARARAVQAVRASLQTSLNQLKADLSLRDRLFSQYSGEKHAVSFKPTKAVSSRGSTPESLTRDSAKLQSVRELSEVISEAKEIRLKVADDLNLLRRLLKK